MMVFFCVLLWKYFYLIGSKRLIMVKEVYCLIGGVGKLFVLKLMMEFVIFGWELNIYKFVV